jgi:hypothetical protein
MFDRLTDLLFGTETRHPLDLSRDEHRRKQIELEEKQADLRERKRELEAALEEKKQAFFDARDAGDDQRAEELQRDAEDIKTSLETVQAKLDTVDQMLTTVGNFLNVYELQAFEQDRYWERLQELDREELVKEFSKAKLEIEDLVEVVEASSTASKGVIDDVADTTSQLHATSDLDWDAEYEARQEASNRSESESVFDDIETDTEGSDAAQSEVDVTDDLSEEALDDLQLS